MSIFEKHNQVNVRSNEDSFHATRFFKKKFWTMNKMLHDFLSRFTATGCDRRRRRDASEEQKKKVPAWRSPSTPSSRPRFSALMRSPCYTKSDFWVKVSLKSFRVDRFCGAGWFGGARDAVSSRTGRNSLVLLCFPHHEARCRGC